MRGVVSIDLLGIVCKIGFMWFNHRMTSYNNVYKFYIFIC